MIGKFRLVAISMLLAMAAVALTISATAAGAGTDAVIDSGSIDQNEISLALVPGTVAGQPQVLLAAYNDGPLSGTTGLGVSYSTDGGANWTSQQLLPYPTHSLGYTMVEAWDPAAAADTLGNLYVVHISTDGNWGPGPASGLYVHKSTNGGVTWQTPVPVSEDGPALGSPDPNYRLNDRDQMTVDRFSSSPRTDNIYITWIKDRGWNMSQPYSDIYFAYSTNGAAGFNLATGVTQLNPDGTYTSFPGRINDIGHDMGNMPVPAVAPDGTVYVSWLDYSVWTGGTGTIYLDKSTDGGVTWGQDVTVRTIDLPPLNVNPLGDNTRAKGAPVLEVSPNNSSELYLVYAENPDVTTLPDGTIVDGPDDADIMFIKSTNGGATWSTPLRVNDDSTLNDQILPWIDVKPNGTIDLAWYDRRNSFSDSLWDVFVTKSVDGGTTFSTNQSINDTSFASPSIAGEGRLGEYPGLAADSSHMYVAWTTSVADTLGDIYFDKQSNAGICTSGKPPLSLGSPTAFWASMADYTAGTLSVTYTIQNNGVGSANNASVTSSTATNSVTCITGMPVSLGTITASGSKSFTLKYSVPTGVTRFIATVLAAADDECGNSYTYP
jgi:hypothetical protein